METDIFSLSKSEKEDLKAYSISALILFGSQAQDLAGSKSDFDIGVISSDQKMLYDDNKRKNTYDFLYNLFSDKINRLVDIDIVFLETAPAELQSHVIKYGKIIFESSPGIFDNFKARIMEQYADFAPLRNIFHLGIFSRIP